MLKVLKTFIIILSVSFLTTSCSSSNTVSKTTGPVNSTSPTQVNSTPGTVQSTGSGAAGSSSGINNINDLFSAEHTLKIQKKGSTTYYETTKLLTSAVADLLIKANEIISDSSLGKEIIKGFDMQKYDYKLRFDGAKDLLLSIKDNIVHFEGDNKLYQLWGDTSNLWNNITLDKSNAMDLKESGLEIMKKQYSEVITEDGKKTDINLIYKTKKDSNYIGDLILRIGKSEVTVYKDLTWQLRPEPTIYEAPFIKFLSQKNKNSKSIIVYFSWMSGGNQTGEVFAYSYKNGNIQSISLTAPETNFKYDTGNKYTAEFPETNSSQDVRFDSAAYQRGLASGTTLKSLLSNKQTFYNQPFAFLIKDYNGDGSDELCSMSSLMFESSISMSMGIEYTFYSAQGDTIKPVKVIIAAPFDDNDKTTQIEREFMELLFDYGKITLGSNGISDSWYEPSKDYSQKELVDVVNRLVNNKFLKKNGNIVYFNF